MGQVFDNATAPRRVLIDPLHRLVLQVLITSNSRPKFAEEGFSTCREKGGSFFTRNTVDIRRGSIAPETEGLLPDTFQGVAMTMFGAESGFGAIRAGAAPKLPEGDRQQRQQPGAMLPALHRASPYKASCPS